MNLETDSWEVTRRWIKSNIGNDLVITFLLLILEKTCPDTFIHLFHKTKAEIHNCSYNKLRKQFNWQILQVSQMEVQKAITTRTIWGAEYHRHIALSVTVFPYHWVEASDEAEEWREVKEHKKDQRCEMIKGVKDQRCETEIGKISQRREERMLTHQARTGLQCFIKGYIKALVEKSMGTSRHGLI